jgi:type VI protein secretion system component VasF
VARVKRIIFVWFVLLAFLAAVVVMWGSIHKVLMAR